MEMVLIISISEKENLKACFGKIEDDYFSSKFHFFCISYLISEDYCS